VPGSEFIFDICEIAAKKDYGVFIYGAKEEINKTAVNRLQNRYPQLSIVGRSNGYVKDSEMPALIERINGSHADILFLALGSPKQEKWFATFCKHLKYVKVCQCIGGTLDTIAGNVKRAPELWQKYSLEWLYRLIIQPSRIKRQKILPLFAYAVLKTKLKYLIANSA
jgi:N-acetylglucosaminyldiphosphoundecaprenol N-acetyl-beta-D-mannosaminyltransferase